MKPASKRYNIENWIGVRPPLKKYATTGTKRSGSLVRPVRRALISNDPWRYEYEQFVPSLPVGLTPEKRAQDGNIP